MAPLVIDGAELEEIREYKVSKRHVLSTCRYRGIAVILKAPRLDLLPQVYEMTVLIVLSTDIDS